VMAQSPVVEVLTQSPSAAEPAGPFIMARRTAPPGSTGEGPGFEEALALLDRAHLVSLLIS
jgi:hypothetical protein